MNKFLLSCLAGSLLAGAGSAQTSDAPPVPVDPAAPAAPVVPAARPAPPGPPVQLLEHGSFELPRVQTRKPKLEGGNILMFTSDEWMTFQGDPERANGTLTVGLTNEISHTGRQSIFVEFNKLRKAKAQGILASQLIRVRPGASYRAGLWGRMDKKHPLTLDQPLPSLRLQIDFFEADTETQTGDQVFRVQPMPGSPDRPPFFITKSWREYYADMVIPEEAAYAKITWTWLTPPENGEINGVMFFDDATFIGEKVEPPAEVPEPPDPANPAPAATPDGTPAAPAPASEAAAPPANVPALVPLAPAGATPAPVAVKSTPAPAATKKSSTGKKK